MTKCLDSLGVPAALDIIFPSNVGVDTFGVGVPIKDWLLVMSSPPVLESSAFVYLDESPLALTCCRNSFTFSLARCLNLEKFCANFELSNEAFKDSILLTRKSAALLVLV